MLFRQIVFYALLVGILSGVVLSVVQFWQVIPIIQTAEGYENSSANVAMNDELSHDDAFADKPSADAHSHSHSGHSHSAGSWSPKEGFERTSFTFLSNVLTAMGMALLLLFAIVSSNKKGSLAKLNWRYGLLWGVAGYAVFYLVPSLGVPPKMPGMISAPLETRQLWWLVAVSSTAIGLAVIAFTKSPWRWGGLAIFAVPYFISAPQAPAVIFSSSSPQVINELTILADQFVSATAIANATFWLALGLTSVWAARRIISSLNN